ncbi:MAG: hypothetical protein EON54_10445 [Alcaligenaceae bacterium]|nr:MAG: hypothetical protein EON54_10445 [Alcaligenaceae bacterium]
MSILRELNLQKAARKKMLTGVWLVFVSIVAIFGLRKIYMQSIGMRNGDAEWIYLPAGRKLLDDPINFITTDILSYSVAPLGYVWSAIWGVNEIAIKLANCALFLICIYLLWRIALRLGGVLAAMAATLVWATTHTLLHAIPQVLTEAMYMFGFLLFIFGLVEAIVSSDPKIRWFTAASLGLTITLLSRPVLQYLICGVLVLMFIGYCLWRGGIISNVGSHTRIIFRRALYALLLALVLPILVIVKNGVYFNSWSIGTGAGAGLYYGVHPLHMGEEPFYTNFQYDVGHTASTIDPTTQGNLEIQADRWQKQIAVHLISQTSVIDNIRFFASKARSWLLYSPVERHFDSDWRAKRQAMVILVIAASLVLGLSALIRGGGAALAAFGQISDDGIRGHENSDPSDSHSRAKGMLFCYVALIFLTLGMIAQFLPILYNARYNGAFLDPLFVILGSVSLALLATHIRWPAVTKEADWRVRWSWRKAAGQLLFLALLIVIHKAAGDWALRHERLVLDPYRLGPVAVVLDASAFGKAEAIGMNYSDNNEWVNMERMSEIAVPFSIPVNTQLGKEKIYEAVWRVNFRVRDGIPSTCRDVAVSYSHPENTSSPLPTRIFLDRSAEMRAYAFSAGSSLRPQGSGKLIFKFNCPVGTRVMWGGGEFLRSTIAESSRDLIRNGIPFSPYQTQN